MIIVMEIGNAGNIFKWHEQIICICIEFESTLGPVHLSMTSTACATYIYR